MNSQEMVLSNEQVQQLVKDRPRKNQIAKGVSHQDRLRFHTDTVLHKFDLSPYYWDFLRWVGSGTSGSGRSMIYDSPAPEMMAPDKLKRFRQFLTVPIQTNDLCESIYTNLFRIFMGEDAHFDYQFTSDELHEDWQEYRDDSFWKTEGFSALQNAIDSVWIVDIAGEQSGFRPEPANLLINIHNVIDISVDESNNCDHLIFYAGEKLYVYDSEKFMIYTYIKKQISAVPESEIMHGLGYTPARMFWNEKLESKNNINKKAPISNELSDLDWLLVQMTNKKYMDMANSYPITVAYEDSDDYENDDREINKDRRPDTKQTKGKNLMGVGGVILVPVPGDGEIDLMSNPIKLISPDVATLKHHNEQQRAMENAIFDSVVGVGGEPDNEQAKNEKQVQSSFESRIDVLIRIKKNFEVIQTFAESTICRLRYGSGFVGISIDYGSKFFMKSVKDMHEDYSTAKSSGANDSVLEMISNNILKAKFRNDSRGLTRAKIIGELDPLPERTIEEAITLFEKGAIGIEAFTLKSNLLAFVRRFEREEMPVTEFGKLIDYDTKIEQIRSVLDGYLSEIITNKIKNE